MATHRFSAYGYVKVEIIEKIEDKKIIWGYFFPLSKQDPLFKRENFTALYNLLMGVLGSAMDG